MLHPAARSTLIALAISGTLSTAAQAEVASPSSAFRDSVGVNVHLSAPDTAYYNSLTADRLTKKIDGQSASIKVMTLVTELGVKHMRDDLCDATWLIGGTLATSCARGLETARTLGQPVVGVKTLDSWFGNAPSVRTTIPSPAEIDRQVTLAAANASFISGLEGPNEIDQKGIADWQKKVSAAQSYAAAKVAQYSALDGATFLNASMGKAAATSLMTSFTGDATYAAYDPSKVEAANIHEYMQLNTPEAFIAAGPSNAAYTCTAGQPAWKSCAQRLLGGNTTKPIWITETGYTNAPNAAEGINQQSAATYLPRVLLEGWRQKVQLGRGFDRTYLYELIDSKEGSQCANNNCNTDRESGFGLVTADYTRKLQFYAVKRLLAVLKPENAAVAPDLNVTVSQPDQSQVRRLLFSVGNGKFVLALWRPVSVYRWPTCSFGSCSPGSSIPEGTAPNTTQNVTITLPSAMPATLYRPSIQDGATETRTSATTHTITVRGDVTLVKLG